MPKLQLHEQGRLSESKNSEEGVFDVTIITEGTGSTGVYTRHLLESAAASSVFDKGTKSFIDHPKDPNKPWERSLTSIAGKLVEDAHFVEENGVGSLKSKLKVDSRWRDFVEEYKDVIGLSIYIGAYGEEEIDGRTVVESFDGEDPYKSVDVVIAAGRGGRFDQAIESYRTIENSLGDSVHERNDGVADAHRTNHKKDISVMEIDELAGKVDALTKVVEGLATLSENLVSQLTSVQESLKPAETLEIDENQVVESLIESGLTKRSRKAVLEAVRNGAVVEEAINEAKAAEDEFREELRVQEGFVQGDGTFTGPVTDLGKVFG